MVGFVEFSRANRKTKIKRFGWIAASVIGIAIAAGLGGCSSDKSAFTGKASPRYEGSGQVPRGGGIYKIGNPYKIAGKTYFPKEDTTYDNVGMASWYGEDFHKRRTANGEWYDMNALTAAHPTLPLPSYVRVTNLKNKKSLVVRVNDRGPYAHGRIIDMSKRSAEVLGFQGQGITKVRVEFLAKAPIEYSDADITAMNNKYGRRGKPNATIAMQKTEHTITPVGAKPEGFYVQAASFSDRENAMRLSQRLKSMGRVAVDPLAVGDQTYYRVRIGPMQDQATAHRTLDQVQASGQRDAHLVSN